MRQPTRWALVLLLTLATIPALAQPLPPDHLRWWNSCEELKQACAEADPMDIFSAANLCETSHPFVGTCYVHTRCPSDYPYACDAYVKLSYGDGDKGWDGGTGCLEPVEEAAKKLKELCTSGACCCPNLAPKPCPNYTPTRGRDPVTGSCCNFPNPCTIPQGWQLSSADDPLCQN